VGGIGVSGPTQRLGIDRVPAVAELVMAATDRVTAGLGGTASTPPAEPAGSRPERPASTEEA
jgi:hypothetical protein